MKREDEIKQAAEQYAWVGDLYDIQAAFTAGAKWADANPTHCSVRMVDSQSYSKQQLREMGFAFDLNGNILSPNHLAINAAKYAIEKACEVLKEKNEMCMYELEMILVANLSMISRNNCKRNVQYRETKTDSRSSKQECYPK